MCSSGTGRVEDFTVIRPPCSPLSKNLDLTACHFVNSRHDRGFGRLRHVVFKAVIFDLYETLISQFDPSWEPPRLSVALRLNIEEDVFQRYWEPLSVSWRKGCPARYKEVLEAVCEAAGRPPDRQAITDFAMERHNSRLPPFENVEPAIIELVDRLRSCGFKLGVLTNSASDDVEPWFRSRLAPYIEAFIASCSVGLLKPDRRIHECCLEALGVNAAEAVFFGDSGNEAMNELDGTLLVGMSPLWATWFLDRWPPGTRRVPGREPPFPDFESRRTCWIGSCRISRQVPVD